MLTEVVYGRAPYPLAEMKEHYIYLMDKMIEKVAFKKLYAAPPICLTHYYDEDGPSFCNEQPVQVGFLPVVNIDLAGRLFKAVCKVYRKSSNVLRYSGFFNLISNCLPYEL